MYNYTKHGILKEKEDKYAYDGNKLYVVYVLYAYMRTHTTVYIYVHYKMSSAIS